MADEDPIVLVNRGLSDQKTIRQLSSTGDEAKGRRVKTREERERAEAEKEKEKEKEQETEGEKTEEYGGKDEQQSLELLRGRWYSADGIVLSDLENSGVCDMISSLISRCGCVCLYIHVVA